MVNGEVKNIEDFLKSKHPLQPHQHFVLKVSKKYLKQLNADNLEIKWSAISSKIDLVSADAFFEEPKSATSATNSHLIKDSNYEVRRIGSKEIELFDISKNEGF